MWKKIFSKIERKNLSKLHVIGYIYESETWCLKEREAGIMIRAERAMMRVAFRANLIDKKNTKELMEMLGLIGSIEIVANANAMLWYGHVLRREEGSILIEALDFEVGGEREEDRSVLGKTYANKN